MNVTWEEGDVVVFVPSLNDSAITDGVVIKDGTGRNAAYVQVDPHGWCDRRFIWPVEAREELAAALLTRAIKRQEYDDTLKLFANIARSPVRNGEEEEEA